MHPRSKYLYDICPQCKGQKSKTAEMCMECFKRNPHLSTGFRSRKLTWRTDYTYTDKWRCIDCNSFYMHEYFINRYHKDHKTEPFSSLPQPNSREKRMMKALGIKSKLSLYVQRQSRIDKEAYQVYLKEVRKLDKLKKKEKQVNKKKISGYNKASILDTTKEKKK